ncbi:MAG: hypothetical protein ACLFV5_02610 [Anaerolineales bacterium]
MSDRAQLDVAPAIPCGSGGEAVSIDAPGMYYKQLNEQIKRLADKGVREITVSGLAGQRYLGTNLRAHMRVFMYGVPGNDLGAFMDGPQIEVFGSVQDGVGNTMNDGSIVVHGSAGDIVGHSMRGGEIYIRDNVGYRVGIHMKQYEDVRPVIVIGGTAQHFLGEYMAGGVLIVLGRQLDNDERHPSRYIGTGMHGGVIYMRGAVDEAFLGQEVGIVPMEAEDKGRVEEYMGFYAEHFDMDLSTLLSRPFTKLVPLTKRPYGRLYAY